MIASAVALCLLAAAIWAVLRQHDGLIAAWDALRSGAWPLAALSLILPLANWLLTSVLFWALMRPRADQPGVPLPEMTLLIGSAWLANYLPVRPGLFGRIAYHKAVNQIDVRRSVGGIVAAVALGALCVALALLIAAAAHAATLSGPLLFAALASPLAIFLPACFITPARALAIAASARYLDVLVWMARYAVVFTLVGRPLRAGESAAMAAVSQAANLVPFVGNGLGIREWAIRLVSPALPAWYAGSEPVSANLALTADLVNRAAELCAAIPVGLACAALLLKLARPAIANNRA